MPPIIEERFDASSLRYEETPTVEKCAAENSSRRYQSSRIICRITIVTSGDCRAESSSEASGDSHSMKTKIVPVRLRRISRVYLKANE